MLPEPNIPLLRKAVEWAEAEAAKPGGVCLWDQTTWATPTDCGTAYCIAGYTVAVAGHTIAAEIVHLGADVSIVNVDGEPAAWTETAGGLLGATEDEAVRLFEPDNEIADVRRIAEEIAARAGERL